MDARNTGKVELFGLVRDRNGRPKFDDIHVIHPNIWAMLTTNEKLEVLIRRSN